MLAAGAGGWNGNHTIREAHAEFEPTHLTTQGRSARFFDHIMTSAHLFSVRTAGYDHSVREGDERVSDHSIVYATLATGGEQFDDVHAGADDES